MNFDVNLGFTLPTASQTFSHALNAYLTMKPFDSEQKEYFSQSFNNLDLSGQRIEEIDFEDCSFTDANFSETVFKRCKFIDCQFNHCNISNAKFAHTRFTEVEFIECKVIGIDWTKAAWPNLALFSPIKFRKCVINDSTFWGLSLNELVIDECRAHYVDFRSGSFREANFQHTDFANALFNETDLSGADFTEATNYQIDLNYNKLKSAKFSRYEAVHLLDSLGIELVD